MFHCFENAVEPVYDGYLGADLKGVARGGPRVPGTPFISLFLSKQPTIFRGENAMTILFDPV